MPVSGQSFPSSHNNPVPGWGDAYKQSMDAELSSPARGSEGCQKWAFAMGCSLTRGSPLISFFLSWGQVFRCLPTDAVTSHRVLRDYVGVENLASVSPIVARDQLRKVEGHLVQFPLEFLAEESLLPPLNSKEGMIPVEVWT